MTRRRPARDYRVAIPSHRRADRLAATTLAILLAGRVDERRVTVFVDDTDPTIDGYRALGVEVVALPTTGIAAARQAIARHYPPGTPVVCLDDDVTGIVRNREGELHPIADLDRWLRDAFTTTAGHDLHVWGVGPVPNAFYMRRQVTTGLRFVIGTLYGFTARPDHPVHAPHTVPVKEDYETSLRAWWWDGGVVRLGDVAVQADHYKAPGGCVDTRTTEASETAARELISQWPGLVRRNTRRASGHAEITLATKGRHTGHPHTRPPPGARARSA